MAILKIESAQLYNLMIYYGVATLHFYRKDIVPLEKGQTLGVFAEKNKKILERVFQEVLMLMKYELSHSQIGKIVELYTCKALSVDETKVGGELMSTTI